LAAYHDNFDGLDSSGHPWNPTNVGPKRTSWVCGAAHTLADVVSKTAACC